MRKKHHFEWDDAKDSINQNKHGVSFALSQLAFLDQHRVILEDIEHSSEESRYYCLGRVAGGILTVRLYQFTDRTPDDRVTSTCTRFAVPQVRSSRLPD